MSSSPGTTGVTAADFITDAAAAIVKLKAEIREEVRAETIKVNVIAGVAMLLIMEYRHGRHGRRGRGGDDGGGDLGL